MFDHTDDIEKCTLINLVNISVNLSKSRILSKKKLFQACFWLKILLILSYFISIKAALETSSLCYLRVVHAVLCKFSNGTRTYKHYSFFYLRFLLNQFSRFYLFRCFFYLYLSTKTILGVHNFKQLIFTEA